MPTAKKIIILFLSASIVSGCVTDGSGPDKSTIGAAIGGIAGALLGSRFGQGGGKLAMMAAGGVAGAAIGGMIGRRLDEADRQRHEAAVQQALAQQSSASWSNPSNNTQGSVKLLNAYNSGGSQCSDVQHAITVEGRTETTTSAYCRQQDGSWSLVN